MRGWGNENEGQDENKEDDKLKKRRDEGLKAKVRPAQENCGAFRDAC